MNCNVIQPANITVTPFIGSVSDPYAVQVNISQRLCSPCCVAKTPVFTPNFSYKGATPVGDGLYMLTFHVEGMICYTPVGTCGCCDKTQSLSQDFTIPVASTTVPVVSFTAGSSVNTIAVTGCQTASRAFVSETPISISLARAAAATTTTEG